MVIKFDGSDLMDGSKKIGFLDRDGKTIKDAKNKKVGTIDGVNIRNASGVAIAKFDGKTLRTSGGTKIKTIDEIQKIISGYGDSKLVAFYVLLLM